MSRLNQTEGAGQSPLQYSELCVEPLFCSAHVCLGWAPTTWQLIHKEQRCGAGPRSQLKHNFSQVATKLFRCDEKRPKTFDRHGNVRAQTNLGAILWPTALLAITTCFMLAL